MLHPPPLPNEGSDPIALPVPCASAPPNHPPQLAFCAVSSGKRGSCDTHRNAEHSAAILVSVKSRRFHRENRGDLTEGEKTQR